MQIRKVLTDSTFLSALNQARTETARKNEFDRLTTYEKNLTNNMQALEKALQFDIGFASIRACHDSQYVIQCLHELTEKAASDKITDDELIKLLRDFFSNRSSDVANTRMDYFPALPTDANKLLWQLAELLTPFWPGENMHPAKVLIPTLKKPGYPADPHHPYIEESSEIVLNETREYAISLQMLLNRFAKELGLTHDNPILHKRMVMLLDDEIVRAAAAYIRYANPPKELQVSSKNNIPNAYRGLKQLRTKCVNILAAENNRIKYYKKDEDYYHDLLRRPWLLNNLPLLFDLMSYLPECHFADYVEQILSGLSEKEIAKIPYRVNEQSYYNNDPHHDGAVLYFFLEVRKRQRDAGYEYNSYIPLILSKLSKTLADALAHCKTDKDAAISICQNYIISGKPRGEQYLRAYFVETEHESLLSAMKQGKLGQVYEQIKLLGKQNQLSQKTTENSVAKQGLFAELDASKKDEQQQEALAVNAEKQKAQTKEALSNAM